MSGANVDKSDAYGNTYTDHYSYFGGIFGGGVEFRVARKASLIDGTQLVLVSPNDPLALRLDGSALLYGSRTVRVPVPRAHSGRRIERGAQSQERRRAAVANASPLPGCGT